MASQTPTESAPKTLFLSEQLKFQRMELESHGENRVRKQATITGNGPFTDTSTELVITISANQVKSMALLQNSYIVVDITNNNTNDIYFQGKGGTIMCIESLTLENIKGNRFNYFRDYNVLAAIELCKNMDAQYQVGIGASLFGLSDSDIEGEVLLGTKLDSLIASPVRVPTPITKIIPMGAICNLFKLCPLWGSEDIRITLKFANPKSVYRCDAPVAVLGVATTTAVIEAGSVSYSNLKFIYETIDIPPMIIEGYLKSMGNLFYMSGSDWESTNATIPENTTNISVPIPIVKNCVKRVIACLRTSDNIQNVQAVSICSRNRCAFTECYLTYNSSSFPVNTIKMKASSISEQLAEMVISQSNNLMNLSPANIPKAKYELAEGDALTDETCGLFWFEFYLGNHLEDNNSTYSGLKVTQNNLSLNLNGGGVNDAQRVDIFVEYAVDYILNNGIWEVRF